MRRGASALDPISTNLAKDDMGNSKNEPLTPCLAPWKDLADCYNCHAIVCSQKSDYSSHNGSVDFPHTLVCGSPENCQDERKKQRRQASKNKKKGRDSSRLKSGGRGKQYPTQLASAARKG